MGSEWEAPPTSWAVEGEIEGQIIAHHLNFFLAHTYSIIFGKGCQHMRQKQVVQHFGFTRNILEWAGSAKQLPGQGSSTAGHLAHTSQLSFFWLFSHLVQTCHHPVLCKQLTFIKARWLGLLSQEPGNLGSSPVLKKASKMCPICNGFFNPQSRLQFPGRWPSAHSLCSTNTHLQFC